MPKTLPITDADRVHAEQREWMELHGFQLTLVERAQDSGWLAFYQGHEMQIEVNAQTTAPLTLMYECLAARHATSLSPFRIAAQTLARLSR